MHDAAGSRRRDDARLDDAGRFLAPQATRDYAGCGRTRGGLTSQARLSQTWTGKTGRLASQASRDWTRHRLALPGVTPHVRHIVDGTGEMTTRAVPYFSYFSPSYVFCVGSG